MTTTPDKLQDRIHDETLIDWFLALTPAERLEELESRLEFFNSARRHGKTELPADSSAV